jgi:addiction module HigA family antidote
MAVFANPIHPGEFLREEYLKPLDMSAGLLARRLGLPRTRIERLVKQEVSLTADTALRLARFFNTTPQFWMNFQLAHDLHEKERELATTLSGIEPLEQPA